MLDVLPKALASLMIRVRVNHLQGMDLEGSPVLVKRRRLGAGIIIAGGNLFLCLAHSGIRMFVRARPWIDWEVHCGRLLYPELPPPHPGSGRSIILPRLPGASLRRLLRQDQSVLPAIIAAARELKRAHQITCPHFGAAWSHGDLHLDNILYDSSTDRAFLIDFDTRHDLRLAPVHRHADDILVMLLELLTHKNEQWQPLAAALLQVYGEPVVLQRLAQSLTVPRGFAKVLWHTRTLGCPARQIEPRLDELRQIIQRVLTPDPAPPEREI